MKTKRFLSAVLVLLLVCSLPISAFADTYDLAQGSVIVNATESGQTVTHGTNAAVPDSAPVITQSNSEIPTTNTVTIRAGENATANVTIQDVNIAISDPSDGSGKAAVTIDVADNASANVILDGVNIDVGETGAYDPISGKDIPGEAAVQITGNGDVTMELDGENTVQGGNMRAGVEKNTTDSTGKGNLTITDENGTAGSLNATGGDFGSGIGGGLRGSGSNITITGSAEVTATSVNDGSGIGGGGGGSGSNITISGSAKVTATSVDRGSGIGGGSCASGSNITITGNAQVEATGGEAGSGIGGGNTGSGSNITISGSAQVEATGGDCGSGIGGGYLSSGSSNITVSQDAQVKAQGGKGTTGVDVDNIYNGAGAAIGEGGKWSNSSPDNIDGEDILVTTDALNEGWIAKYAPSDNMKTAIPGSVTYKDASGTVQTATQNIQLEDALSATCTEAGHEAGFRIDGALVAVTIPATDHSFTNYVSDNNATYDHDGTKTAKCDHCDATHTIPDPGSKLAWADAQPLYRVINQDGKDIPHQDARKDGVLTITVEADFASLTGTLGGIQTLKAQGVDTIVFVTNGATSTFALPDLLTQGSTGDSYTLTHNGDAVTFTLNNGADAGTILK